MNVFTPAGCVIKSYPSWCGCTAGAFQKWVELRQNMTAGVWQRGAVRLTLNCRLGHWDFSSVTVLFEAVLTWINELLCTGYKTISKHFGDLTMLRSLESQPELSAGLHLRWVEQAGYFAQG
jgi:hypothetical protein